MKKNLSNIYRFYLVFVLIFYLIGTPTDICAQSSISLDQVIYKTAENNPQIKVSLQNLKYSEGSYRIARSNFNTDFRLTGQNYKSESATLDESNIAFDNKAWNYLISASRKISFGTVITPVLGVSSSGTGADGVPTNRGSAFINFQQPILRGIGTSYNTAGLRVARLDISSSEHHYFFDASSLILISLNSYVEYISAQLNLQIQLETEASMKKTVDQMTRLVDLDAIPGSELIVSKANLANQQTNTSLAQNRLALSQNLLATAMGITLDEVISMGQPPVNFPVTISLIKIDENYSKSWYSKSMSLRHDYLATVNEQEASIIGLDFSKKGMLPRLNLTFGAGYNGIYKSQALDQYYRPFTSNYSGMNYNIGLSFDIAPRYDLEKGRRVQAIALNEAADAKIEFLQLQIKKEIQQDCDQIKYLMGAIESVNDAVEFSEKALENEKKKLELAISTAFNVALMQNSYLNVMERQNGLLEQLNQAILRFKHHTGTLLDATGSSTFTVNSNQLFLLQEAP